jgi:3-oxosteroid 1-dehydrogenase
METDMVVVGSGAAGMAAAAAGVEAGRSVVVLEKAGTRGGTTAKSSGAYWIPNNSFLRARGIDDPKADAVKLMARLSYPSLYDPEAERLGLDERSYGMLDAYYDSAAHVIEHLEAIGALASMPQPLFGEQVADVDWAIPEYHSDLPENKTPYGRTLLPNFDPMAGVLGGAEIVNQLHAYVTGNGGEVRTDCRVTGLVFEHERVVGVRVEDKTDGSTGSITAADGVVFASGGFTHDRAKVLAYLRGPIFGGCAVPTNTGDFIDIAASAGAALGNLSNAFWSQSVLENTLADGQVAWDQDVFIPFGDSMIIVNKYGERISSEKVVYHERTQTHFVFDPQAREYPNEVQFMIWDSAVADYEPWHMYRYPVPVANEEASWVIEGQTWEELASRIDERLVMLAGVSSASTTLRGVRLSPTFVPNLLASVDRFNGFARAGVDTDFARGSTPIQLSWGSVPREGVSQPNPTMRPFADSGPYYCTLLCAGTLDTCGGPVTDERGEVLRPDGTPVAGLFGAGNCVSSPAGQAYWSAGSTLGPALTFGYLAGKQCAAGHARHA